MKVGLFDSNFSHSSCSVAWATSKHVEYVRNPAEFDGVVIFTDAWIHNPIVKEVKSETKIAWLHEPFCLHQPEYEAILKPEVLDQFDKVLTYRQDLLNHPSGKFEYCIYGGVWIPQAQWGLHPKTRLVSMLYGDKMSTYGHQLRHLIGNMIPPARIDYFGFQGQKTDYSQRTKLRVLSPYMFSIVIETCREDWLFTEILLDCFACGTVPVFWGCPEIGKFFDQRGILSFETLPQLEAILDTISPEMYMRMLEYAKTNLEEMGKYAVTEDWMYHNVLRKYE